MTTNNNSVWENEFLEVNLTDLRLKNRLFKIMDAFWESPSQSVWSATNSRNQAKAAYRFWSNPNISRQELMDSIARATIQKMKMANAQRILIIQDTTSISFGSERMIDGMGYYCDSDQKGMMVHSCIAVTDSGIPLGLLCQESYTRETRKDDSRTKEQKKWRPIEEKESYRWLTALKETDEKIQGEVSVLTVCDRESDFYEFFSEAATLGEKFLVRITHPRKTENGKELFERLRKSEVKGTMLVRMSRNPKEHQPSRIVPMDLHYEMVTIRKPRRRKEEHLHESLRLTAVYVHESGKQGTEWFLLTNLDVNKIEEIKKLVECYAHRWKIERFHYVLKSGCNIERKQLRQYSKLSLVTLLYSVIALQILHLAYMGKEYPKLPAEIVFDEDEWKILYCSARRTKILPEKYTLKDVVYDLGILGGTKGAPSDGMPGVRSIWKGLEVLYTLLSYREFLI